MQATDVLDADGPPLREVAETLYEARASFLADHFESYVADTVHVTGVGYVCWPAVEDGRFLAYDDLCGAEERALAPLEGAGFQRVAVGLSRVVLRSPAGDHVVKLARCGMSEDFGDGRWANLLESRISDGVDDGAPVVPSVYCESRGSFGMYPFVERRGPGATSAANTDVEGSVRAIREWLADRAPWLNAEEAVATENLGVWRGRLRTLDYGFGGGEGPMGVPAHVDHRQVVAAVDRQRRDGRKRDIRDGGGFVEPGGE